MEYKWIAQNEDGTIDKYTEHPKMTIFRWLGGMSGAVIENPTRERVQGKLQRKITNWRDSLINLETHDYKIEDGILMKVEKEKIYTSDEIQWREKGKSDWKAPYNQSIEFRLKPKTVKFRNYLNNTGKVKTTTTESTEKETFFVKWIGCWQEVDIDAESEQQWPTELIARIAKIDINAAEWLRNNFDELESEKYMRPGGNNKNSDTLINMFSWCKTPQKECFWKSISKKLGEQHEQRAPIQQNMCNDNYVL